MSTGFFHVPLQDKTYSLKFEQRMENNSELNNRAAQYTLCFNAQCSKAESCLRHSMTQYNTAQNARLSVINPLCYPAAGKECPHFRTNKKVRVAWGFKTPLRQYACTHFSCHPPQFGSYLQAFSLLPVSQSEAGTHSETTGMYPPSMQKAWLE